MEHRNMEHENMEHGNMKYRNIGTLIWEFGKWEHKNTETQEH